MGVQGGLRGCKADARILEHHCPNAFEGSTGGPAALIPIIVIPCSNFLCFTVGFLEFAII